MAKIPPINLSSSFNTFRTSFNKLVDSVGDLATLTTDTDSDVVKAINSIDSNLGTRSSLTTSNANVVTAINELDAELGTITSGAMGTTASTVSGAIAELDSRLDSINNTQLNTAALYVSGNAQIDGTLTVDGTVNFKAGSSGSVALGDDNTDNVVFNADVNSNIIPNTDSAYSLGSDDKRWKHVYTQNLSADSSTITSLNVTGTLTAGSLTVDSAHIQSIVDSNLVAINTSIAAALDSAEAQAMIDSNLVAINASIAAQLDSAEAQAIFDSNFADSNVIATIANRSIANSKLTNNTITVNGISIALGAAGNIDITDSGSSVALIKSTMKADSDTGIHYDSATARFSLDKIPNSSITNSTFSVNGVSGNLGANITVDIVDSAEVIALARGGLSVTDDGGDGSLTYTSGTGVFTYTGPSASEVRAHFTAGEGIDITSGEIAGEDATTANKGIASFNSASFSTSSGEVSIKTGGVSNDQLAGSIANAKLVNSTFSVNGVSGSLGANIEIPTIDSNGTINLIGGQFSALPATVSRTGDLTIDVSGDITLDADGGQIYLDDAGSQRGYLDIATASTIKLYTGASTLNSTWSGDDLQVEGDVTSVSDARTKENIETITDGLEIVDTLRGVYYNKIGDAERKVGVIAQEVETVLPEVVKTNEDGMKSVDYGKMVGVLIEAIKDLKHEIDDLKRGL